MTYAHHRCAGFDVHLPKADRDSELSELRRVKMFGLDVVSATSDAVIDHILAPGRNSRIAFLNAHCANVLHHDADYADAVASADLVLPDGIGVELAARLCGERIAENLNGTDFTPRLLQAAAGRGMRIFLLGGQPGVATRAAQQLTTLVPGLKVCGTCDGYGGIADEAATLAEIRAARPDILLVAMGVPKQEIWLARNADRLPTRITMGVGALFDFLSGRIMRAPEPIRKLRCEWVWRLAMEPRRMARRYVLGNFAFAARAVVDAVRLASIDRMARRGLDIAISALALVALMPLILPLALAIRADSRGSLIFRQTRVGKNGEHFTLFKFRTMAQDAEARRAGLLSQSDRKGICFKARNDPRVTRVGRFLRRYSLDELPQLLNVLRGDMAIVGPRPSIPEEVAKYPARALGRLAVKPGLTGIWQVSGRADIGFSKMIDMDLAYAKSQSLMLDVLLIALTFRAVLGGRGAC